MRIRDISVGAGSPLLLISGLNVLENRDGALAAPTASRGSRSATVCRPCSRILRQANRSSRDSFRGVGLDEGLRILELVKTARACR